MEPISIAAGTLGAKFLEEAIKFLWSEAGKILDRYREHRNDAASPEAARIVDDAPPAELNLPARRQIDFEVLAGREEALLNARDKLNRYRDGFRPIRTDDKHLLDAVQENLDLLGEIYHQPMPALIVKAYQENKEVTQSGKAIGIEAEGIREGQLESVQKTDKNEGAVIGVHLKR